MARWKMPPKDKIYEAFSVIADGRYAFVARDKNGGKVTSLCSSRRKTYTTEWREGFPLRMTCNDNGSYWKGYIGYPMIAVLMLLGRLRYDPAIAALFAGVEWKALNTQYGYDYTAVTDKLLQEMPGTVDTNAIRAHVEDVYRQLRDIGLHHLPKRKKPPEY